MRRRKEICQRLNRMEHQGKKKEKECRGFPWRFPVDGNGVVRLPFA